MDEDQLEEYYRKKYSQKSREVAEGEEEDYDDIAQQGLLPSTK